MEPEWATPASEKHLLISDNLYRSVHGIDSPPQHDHSFSARERSRLNSSSSSSAKKTKRAASPPMQNVCYLCGQHFGKASIEIHETQCYVKRLLQWERDDPDTRGAAPVEPSTYRAMYGDRVLPGYEKIQMQPCQNCGRAFLPDRLQMHMKGCRKGVFRSASNSPAPSQGQQHHHHNNNNNSSSTSRGPRQQQHYSHDASPSARLQQQKQQRRRQQQSPPGGGGGLDRDISWSPERGGHHSHNNHSQQHQHDSPVRGYSPHKHTPPRATSPPIRLKQGMFSSSSVSGGSDRKNSTSPPAVIYQPWIPPSSNVAARESPISSGATSPPMKPGHSHQVGVRTPRNQGFGARHDRAAQAVIGVDDVAPFGGAARRPATPKQQEAAMRELDAKRIAAARQREQQLLQQQQQQQQQVSASSNKKKPDSVVEAEKLFPKSNIQDVDVKHLSEIEAHLRNFEDVIPPPSSEVNVDGGGARGGNTSSSSKSAQNDNNNNNNNTSSTTLQQRAEAQFVRCIHCQRTFAPDRIHKHEEVCAENRHYAPPSSAPVAATTTKNPAATPWRQRIPPPSWSNNKRNTTPNNQRRTSTPKSSVLNTPNASCVGVAASSGDTTPRSARGGELCRCCNRRECRMFHVNRFSPNNSDVQMSRREVQEMNSRRTSPPPTNPQFQQHENSNTNNNSPDYSLSKVLCSCCGRAVCVHATPYQVSPNRMMTADDSATRSTPRGASGGGGSAMMMSPPQPQQQQQKQPQQNLSTEEKLAKAMADVERIKSDIGQKQAERRWGGAAAAAAGSAPASPPKQKRPSSVSDAPTPARSPSASASPRQQQQQQNQQQQQETDVAAALASLSLESERERIANLTATGGALPRDLPVAKFCSQCGGRLAGGVKFCSGCGSRV